MSIEGPKSGLEPGEKQATESLKGRVFEGVIFADRITPDGAKEYRSSAPGRKIMIHKHGVLGKPLVGRPYRVRVIEDTKPEDPLTGKLIVEITLDQEQEERIYSGAREVKESFARNDFRGVMTVLEKIKKEVM